MTMKGSEIVNDLYIKGLRINWDTLPKNSYVQDIPAIKSITELQFDKPITFFVGENGSGKSTLLEAIAVEFVYNSEGGTRNYNFSTYYDISPLSESITLVKSWQRPKFGYFFRAETFFKVATRCKPARNGRRRSVSMRWDRTNRAP